MGFTIERRGDELLVRINNAGGNDSQVFDAVCACRGQSWWSCPSGACASIGACETRREGDAMLLALTPRAGETISEAGIEECLRYVLDAAAASPAIDAPAR